MVEQRRGTQPLEFLDSSTWCQTLVRDAERDSAFDTIAYRRFESRAKRQVNGEE